VRRRLAVAGACVLLLAVALTVTLTYGKNRGAGDNGQPIVIGVVVPGEKTFCQGQNVIPAEAVALRVWVSTAGEPGGPLRVRVMKDGREIASGSGPGGYVDSSTDIALSPRDGEVRGATVCVENAGPKQAAFMGNYAGPSEARELTRTADDIPAGSTAAVILGQKRRPGERPIIARFDWRLPGSEDSLAYAGVVSERLQFARPSWVGGWTPWALVFAMVVAVLGAVAVLVRGGGEDERV
jgi:hypothetical protein